MERTWGICNPWGPGRPGCLCSQPTLPRAPTWHCGSLLWVGGEFHSRPPSQTLGLLLCLLISHSIEDRAVQWLLSTLYHCHSCENPPLPSLLWAFSASLPRPHMGRLLWVPCSDCPGAGHCHSLRVGIWLGVGAPQFLHKLRQAGLAPGG